MLKIHSFLRRIKENMKYSGIECYKKCLMISAYAMAAVILVLCAEYSYAQSSRSPEAYVKAASVSLDSFDEAIEETAKKAQVQAENENVNISALQVLEGEVAENTENYSLQTVNGTVIAADKQVQAVLCKSFKQTMSNKMGVQVVRVSKSLSKNEKEQVAKVAKAKAKKSDKSEEDKKKKKQEIKGKAAASKDKNKSVQAISLGTKQKQVLLRIVEAEATGEDIRGKMLVANVILNRVKSSQFPNTVEGVVFQKNGNTTQFSPIADGRYWSVTVTKSTHKAVERVLNGEDESQGALYFSARSKAKKSNMSWFDNHLTWLFKYGGHEFYR